MAVPADASEAPIETAPQHSRVAVLVVASAMLELLLLQTVSPDMKLPAQGGQQGHLQSGVPAAFIGLARSI